MIDKRRIGLPLLVLLGILGVGLARLLWLQLATAAGWTSLDEASVLQREERLMLDSGRGQFYDRNGVALTGASYSALLVFPVHREHEGEPEQLRALAGVLHTSVEAWSRFRAKLTVPAYWMGSAADGLPMAMSGETAEAINRLSLEGLAIVPFERRYAPPYTAAQLLGYLSQDPDRVRTEFAPMLKNGRIRADSRIGASGLEKTFEPLIAGLGGTSLSLYTNPSRVPIKGIGYRLHAPDNPYYPLQVTTSLELGLQQRLEQAADGAGLKDGAIVVLNARTSEVLGMVSRPSYNPEHVNPEEPGWSNRALKEAVPGSIFKTVVAAAALEQGAASPNERFECGGAWGHYRFTCWKKEGHGSITFREAYAESCNIVFGQIMERLRPGQLEATARRLGIGLPAGWEGKTLRFTGFRQLDGEEAGRIWADGSESLDPGSRLQTSIGQRNVRMTPLQAANLVATILNGGRGKEVRAVKEVRYQTGRLLASFSEQALPTGSGGISSRTASTLRKWMVDVVESETGTGAALQSARWRLAGKSGTAQAPEGDRMYYNQWFIGYGPVEAPRYAVSVVSLRQDRSGPEAVRLFGRVMDQLAAWETDGTR